MRPKEIIIDDDNKLEVTKEKKHPFSYQTEENFIPFDEKQKDVTIIYDDFD